MYLKTKRLSRHPRSCGFRFTELSINRYIFCAYVQLHAQTRDVHELCDNGAIEVNHTLFSDTTLVWCYQIFHEPPF